MLMFTSVGTAVCHCHLYHFGFYIFYSVMDVCFHNLYYLLDNGGVMFLPVSFRQRLVDPSVLGHQNMMYLALL